MTLAGPPAFAKGEVVQIVISGGDLPQEIRIPANDVDTTQSYTDPPAHPPEGTRYIVTFYVRLGSEIVATPPFRYFPEARPLFHNATSDPKHDWYVGTRPLAQLLDGAISAARAGRYRSAPPIDAVVTSWPLLMSWVLPLSGAVAMGVRRRLKASARPVRAARA